MVEYRRSAAIRRVKKVLMAQDRNFRAERQAFVTYPNRLPQGFAPALALSFVLFASSIYPVLAQNQGGTEGESPPEGTLDMVLLLDKSLSMAPFFDSVKAYVAGQVLGPVLVKGDRLVVEAVYGRVERLFAGTIGSEADKAAAIRAVRAAAADGRYTDLGAALDAAKRDVEAYGEPSRPKYVLLVTDERQEAPPSSAYQAKDYKLRHPSLEYIKRQDLGRFRAITVGIGVGPKVEAAATSLVKYLSEAPARGLGTAKSGGGSTGAGAGGAGSPAAAATSGSAAATTTAAGAAENAPAAAATTAGGTNSAANDGAKPWPWIVGAALLALAIAAIALLKSKKEPDKESHEAR
jgi:hypothetical protein